jgi:DNA uptake protein ComE-like DNA-binding protein
MTRMSRALVLSISLFALAMTTSAGAAPPSNTKPGADRSSTESKLATSPIDINSATLTDLRSLPGVGPAIARKIVAGRPYASVDDLKARKVLPITTYDKIRDRVSVQHTMGEAARESPGLPGPDSGKH